MRQNFGFYRIFVHCFAHGKSVCLGLFCITKIINSSQFIEILKVKMTLTPWKEWHTTEIRNLLTWKGIPYLKKTKNIKPSKNGMEKQKVIMLILLSISSVLSNYGQKEVTYFINEKDTLIYKDMEYVFNKLQYNNISTGFTSLIRRLSLNKSAEMYIMNISKHNGKLLILIQNWEYRGIASLRKRNVYGMYRSKQMKDFLVCYDNSCPIATIKRLFHRTYERISINTLMKILPNDEHIVIEDIATQYCGSLIKNRLRTDKFILNNKTVYYGKKYWFLLYKSPYLQHTRNGYVCINV